MNSLFLIIYVALFAIILNYLTRKEYTTHEKGGIVISGASSGIGYHGAIELANNGFHVFAGVRKEADLHKISKLNMPNLHPVILDVTKEEQISSCLEEVSSFLSDEGLELVGLVNNAGIAFSLPVEVSPMHKFEQTMDVNLYGVIRLTRAFLPLLREAKGRIVNVGSVAGFLYKGGCGAYCVSKAGLEALSDALRRELDFYGVSVSLIQPGAVATPIWDKNTGENAQFLSLSEEEQSLYKHVYAGAKENVEKLVQTAAGPESTSQAMVHAITAKTPKTRYVVATVFGAPAILLSWICWLLPDRVLDILFGGAM